MDTEYLREELGPCLSQCLAEVVMKRPYDPIEFIAYWLYKHADNVQRTKQVGHNNNCFQPLYSTVTIIFEATFI